MMVVVVVVVVDLKGVVAGEENESSCLQAGLSLMIVMIMVVVVVGLQEVEVGDWRGG